MVLREPGEDLLAAFQEMARELVACGESRYLERSEDPAGWLRRLKRDAHERPDRPGWVPGSEYWLVADGRVLGVSRLRHRLTPALEHEGGHVGYEIRPSDRRRGHGTLLLRLTCERAVALGLRRLRVTCDADNLGSIGVIENNGGVLDAEVPSRTRGVLIRQYWIDLSAGRRSS
jgi:predicted acetyltransferase